jgi:hypothetical protein
MATMEILRERYVGKLAMSASEGGFLTRKVTGKMPVSL